MATPDPKERFRAFLERLNSGDLSAIEEYVAPGYEEVYPQSGERIRGPANLRAILEHYPGGSMQRVPGRVVGAEDQWVSTPLFTVIKVEGSGNAYTAVQRVRYPDGSNWHVVTLAELHDGKVSRAETYFAPSFDAPRWRASWVERDEPTR
jgi:hypothetical protein